MSGSWKAQSNGSLPRFVKADRYGTWPQPTNTSPFGRFWTSPMYCDLNVVPCEYSATLVTDCRAGSSRSTSPRDGAFAARYRPAPVISQQWLSNSETTELESIARSCCHTNFASDGMSKLECLPPSCHTIRPLPGSIR